MFKLTVVTPEKRLVLKQEIDEVIVPAARGEMCVLPGHAPLITTLETGILKWKTKGSSVEHKAVISWGYCQVNPEGVEVLADIADLPEDVDTAECNRYITEAETRLANEHLDDDHWESVHREIARMRAQLDISK